MIGYTAQELERAQRPFRDDADRNEAVCVLGGLMTEQRETWSAERAETIRAITAAVQDFDVRAALGTPAPSPASTAATPPVAPPIAPAPPAPITGPPYGAQQRDPGATVRAGGIDLLGAAPAAAHAPAPVDLVADMKRRHGIAA